MTQADSSVAGSPEIVVPDEVGNNVVITNIARFGQWFLGLPAAPLK